MIISVCLCTYKRETLRRTLDSLFAQQLPEDCSLDIVVVDNDSEESGRAIAESYKDRDGPISLGYFVNTERNLAAVRNTTMEYATGDLLAFIDDDEWAETDWIARLCSALSSKQADVVFGHVNVIYPEDAPAWIVEADLFRKDEPSGTTAVVKGATSNALIKSEWVKESGFRFDQQFGKSGGEDTDFFHRIHKAGGRLFFDDRAVVSEVVQGNRLNYEYLRKQNKRVGQTHWFYLWSRQSGLAFVKTGLFVLAQVFGAATMTLLNLPFGKARYMRWKLLLVRNVEKIRVAFTDNANTVELYGNH